VRWRQRRFHHGPTQAVAEQHRRRAFVAGRWDTKSRVLKFTAEMALPRTFVGFSSNDIHYYWLAEKRRN